MTGFAMVHRKYVKTFVKKAAPVETAEAKNKLARQQAQAKTEERRQRQKPKTK